MNQQGTLYVIMIPREEIDGQDISRVRDFVKSFEKANIKSQCVEITISGFDDTNEEVFEIEAIRKWTTKLLKQVPEILYYASIDIGTTTRLLASVYDVSTVTNRRMNAYEAEAYYKEHGELHEQPVLIKISTKELKKICEQIKSYGLKRKDMSGANKIVKRLMELFGGEV